MLVPSYFTGAVIFVGRKLTLPRKVAWMRYGIVLQKNVYVRKRTRMRKGEVFSLSKPGGKVPLTDVLIGLGWNSSAEEAFDVDLSAFLLNSEGKVRSDNDLVFYNSALKRADKTIPSPCGSVVHWGDALRGTGLGDDEKITVALNNVPPEIVRIVFYVSIFKYRERGQKFEIGESLYVRIVDQTSGTELKRYLLPKDFGVSSAMHVGELVRQGRNWYFRAVGQGLFSGLGRIAQQYGVCVQQQSLDADV